MLQLERESEDEENPIIYISRVLNSAERNYSVTEKELLGVIWAIKKFRSYIEGPNYEVESDDSVLKWLNKFKDLTGKSARWSLELQHFEVQDSIIKKSKIKITLN